SCTCRSCLAFRLACGDTRGASWETGHGAQRYQAAIRLYRIGVQGQCGRIEDIEELPIFAEDHIKRLTAWHSSYRSAIDWRQAAVLRDGVTADGTGAGVG